MAAPDDPGSGARSRRIEWGVHEAYAVVVVIGLLLLIYLARGALAPYLLALLGIYILLPVTRFIERQLPETEGWERFRRPVAVLITTAATLLLAGIVLYVLLKPVVEQTVELFENLDTYWESIRSNYPEAVEWYEDNVPADLRTRIEDYLSQLGDALVPGVAGLLGWLVGVTGSLVSAVVSLIAIPLFIVYYLLEEQKTVQNFRRVLPGRWTEDAIAIFRIFDRIMGSYSRGVILMSIIVGGVTGFGYWLIGVDLWLPLGAIAFAGEIVPIIGPWIAFGISFPVILATQPNLAIPAGILFLVVQALEGWFLAPRIEGRAVHFTSAGTLLLLSMGGALAGAVGVIFALPAAAILRALITYGSHRLNGQSADGALEMLPIFQDDQANDEVSE